MEVREDEKRLIDRIMYVDGMLSQAEHMIESLNRQISNAIPGVQQGLRFAMGDARILRNNALNRRNRLIEWHNHLYPEPQEGGKHGEG